MKFPGQRKSKHYFPVSHRDPLLQPIKEMMDSENNRAYIVGIDQTLVDIEAKVDDEFIERYQLSKGHSLVIEDEAAEALYRELTEKNLISHEFAGGTIGNTLHNYSVLADDRSVLLGAMCNNIQIGSYAYRYLCHTSSRMDLNYLQSVDGPIGRCFTLITENGERTFAISPGHMNQLRPESIPEQIIAEASALVLTAYLVRCKPGEPMPEATMQAIHYAKKHNVPVVLTLGTKYVIAQDPQFWREFLANYVSVVAMNEDEAFELTGFNDPLLAADMALNWVDLVLCTAGPAGLYMAAYTEEDGKRKTQHPLLPGAIAEFNLYEFSRAMRKQDCEHPLRIYSHIEPYMGGPEKIMNTNGAGDGALSALLHDITANSYHRMNVPNSSKHGRSYLCYSSLAQVCKYANRVSYQVLTQHSPRLTRGLPEKEDSLEESYWER
ncbi:inosine/guanosine kinase [Moellerella wisconsensis]|uniref:Inosine/guanosine kinase n=1 Tax=Moellerella wisconsensis TaxID=158849 RepID=A0ACD3Y5N8_9GAMM|nr:inosine/guanosine kinase [Moellerella wisconsensis]KLN95996.1 guanosine kinase [Moellerella wisconsensis]UNH38305.1 inosine/guanosine kinase [Moellerella wisconsensis]UNH41819.1 inosine/guanosine kinase [Moellerella wisconsensis]WJW81288.1 inosine/guanosine kinase [Moellerella wisconsensis]